MGAKDRYEGEYRNAVLIAWLGGMLSGVTEDYPTYAELVGDDKQQKPDADPKEASGNARAWAIWLQGENKRAANEP